MPTNRERGARYELKALHELEDADFKVERAQGKVMWIPDPNRPGRRMPITKHFDFFGAFDLIATHNAYLRFIQIAAEGDTSGGDMAEKRRKIEQVSPWFPSTASLELWRWQIRRKVSDGKRIPNGWTKWRYQRRNWRELQS